MRARSALLLLIMALVSLTSWQKSGMVDEWVYEREKQGIKIFTKKGKWGNLRDSKAIMTVADSPEEMLRLLTDFDKYPTWLPRCKKARIVARLNENEFIAQIVFGVPWPFKDRDCVLRVKVEKDERTGTIVVTETSEPKYIKEQEGIVRIQQLVAVWKLAPKGTGTEVTNEYASNPGSDIPDWLTNTQSVETPMNTFENILIKTAASK